MDYHIALNDQASNTSLVGHHLLYIKINLLIGRVEGLYFLIKKTFKSIC